METKGDAMQEMQKVKGAYANEQGEPKKESVANIILGRASKVAAMSNDLTERLHHKLESVMVDEPPTNEKASSEIDSYPPLFHRLRDSLMQIEGNLLTMSRALERTEL